MGKAIKAEIKEYCDYFSTWYGLKDGTMLKLTDPKGQQWVKLYDKTMTVKEFNKL